MGNLGIEIEKHQGQIEVDGKPKIANFDSFSFRVDNIQTREEWKQVKSKIDALVAKLDMIE